MIHRVWLAFTAFLRGAKRSLWKGKLWMLPSFRLIFIKPVWRLINCRCRGGVFQRGGRCCPNGKYNMHSISYMYIHFVYELIAFALWQLWLTRPLTFDSVRIDAFALHRECTRLKTCTLVTDVLNIFCFQTNFLPCVRVNWLVINYSNSILRSLSFIDFEWS